MPKSVSPMLATLATQPPSGDAWLYEVKWDGVRALCFIDEGQLRIHSRTGKRCEQQYPELSVLPRHIKAIAGHPGRRDRGAGRQRPLQLHLIQPRISVADANAVAHLSRSTPVTLFLVRCVVSGRLRSAWRSARRAQAPAGGNRHALRAHSRLRFLHRRRRSDARSRASQWFGRHCRQSPPEQIRRPPQPRIG